MRAEGRRGDRDRGKARGRVGAGRAEGGEGREGVNGG